MLFERIGKEIAQNISEWNPRRFRKPSLIKEGNDCFQVIPGLHSSKSNLSTPFSLTPFQESHMPMRF